MELKLNVAENKVMRSENSKSAFNLVTDLFALPIPLLASSLSFDRTGQEYNRQIAFIALLTMFLPKTEADF